MRRAFSERWMPVFATLAALALPVVIATGCGSSGSVVAADTLEEPGAGVEVSVDVMAEPEATTAEREEVATLPDAVEAAPEVAVELPGPEATPEIAEPAPDVAGETEVVDVAPEVAGPEPSAAGPFPVAGTQTEITRGSRTIPIVTHVPDRPDGKTSPLIVFAPGFQLASTDYSGTLNRLASHGFVVVGATPPASLFSTSHVDMAADLSSVIDWALNPADPLAGKVDPTRIGVMGHSLGGKISVMAAFADSRVKAVFAIDPVNGGSPLTGYSTTLPDIVPDQVAPLAIPLGFGGETTDQQATLGQACAPADQDFLTFYAAASSSPWVGQWTFTEANHMSFLDNPNCGLVCSVCQAAPGDPANVLAAVRALSVAFFRRHFEGDLAMDAWLAGSQVPAGVEWAHKP